MERNEETQVRRSARHQRGDGLIRAVFRMPTFRDSKCIYHSGMSDLYPCTKSKKSSVSGPATVSCLDVNHEGGNRCDLCIKTNQCSDTRKIIWAWDTGTPGISLHNNQQRQTQTNPSVMKRFFPFIQTEEHALQSIHMGHRHPNFLHSI